MGGVCHVLNNTVIHGLEQLCLAYLCLLFAVLLPRLLLLELCSSSIFQAFLLLLKKEPIPETFFLKKMY